jgi:hypothetical protein
MRRPRHVVIDGKPVSSRDVLVAHRQTQPSKAPDQPSLFPLIDDRRPATARRADDRYREPGLFDRTP